MRITIVSGIQLATNPRVVKEADVLSAAGYRVTVLGAALDPALSQRDDELRNGKSWTYVSVLDSLDSSLAGRARRFVARARFRTARELGRRGYASEAQLGYVPRPLLSDCLRRESELYILHHPQSMWVGVQLVRAGKKVAVDFEDWYSRDAPADGGSPAAMTLLGNWERFVLRHSLYSTTTSHALSDALAAEYQCPRPAVVYNAFPFSDRDGIDGRRRDRVGDRVSLTWFSQIVGPDRGLETLMDSLASVRVPIDIHIRGTVAGSFQQSLMSRAPEQWRNHIFFHAQVRHDELLSRLAEHDIGYAGDIPHCANRDLTITNKILQYLLAGLPVLASDTTGRREVAQASGDAVALFSAGNPASLAAAINRVAADAQWLRDAGEAALRAAKGVFSWERSREILVAQVASRLPVREAHTIRSSDQSI